MLRSENLLFICFGALFSISVLSITLLVRLGFVLRFVIVQGMMSAMATQQQVAQMCQQLPTGPAAMAQQQVRPAISARPITWQQPLSVSQQRAAG